MEVSVTEQYKTKLRFECHDLRQRQQARVAQVGVLVAVVVVPAASLHRRNLHDYPEAIESCSLPALLRTGTVLFSYIGFFIFV